LAFRVMAHLPFPWFRAREKLVWEFRRSFAGK
jgi:hypothetical protein